MGLCSRGTNFFEYKGMWTLNFYFFQLDVWRRMPKRNPDMTVTRTRIGDHVEMKYKASPIDYWKGNSR